jgi:hypothetical protein
MFIKIMIRRLKQQADPTLGNKSGRNFDATILDPGTIVNDVRDGDLFPILPTYQGPSAADYSMYELVKKELDKNSVERSFQGINNNAVEKTATQDINEQGAMSLKVASMFDGIIWGENQLNWLRTYSIAKNWTKPIDVRVDTITKKIIEKYRTVNLPSTADGGMPATKKIVFTPETTMTSRQVAQEDINAKKEGKGEIRTAYLNPKMFREMKLNWYYTTVPVPNGSDPLSYMLFAKQIADASAFFGPDSLNVARLKHKFAALTGQDYDTWFISTQELEQKQVQMQQAQQKDIAMGGTGEMLGGGAPGGAGIGASMSANPMSGMANVMK